MSNTMTVRVEDKAKAELDKLAAVMGRSRSSLAGEAISQYIDLSQWQAGELQQALAETDRGEFASDAEVKRWFDGWRRRVG